MVRSASTDRRTPPVGADDLVFPSHLNFTGYTESLKLWRELRKYRVNLILAHQYLAQLDPEVRDAILGNVGTTISFRVGLSDAEILEKEFYPEFSASDLNSLPNYHIYLEADDRWRRVESV